MRKILLPLLFSLFFVSIDSEANHADIEGAEINYRYIGNDRYIVTLKVFYSCPGTPDSTLKINARTSCDSTDFDLPLISTNVISPICRTACTCGKGCYLGTTERVYMDTIDLSSFSCCKVTFSYFAQSARNFGINVYDFYIDAFLDKCVTDGNNSVQFSFNQPSLLYLNKQARINLGGYDMDGDTVIYRLAPYMQNATTQLTAGRPYDDPVQTNSAGFSLDSTSGSMIYTPTGGSRHLIKLEATEYRNGAIVGKISREFAAWTDNYGSNNLPAISGINNTNNFQINACLGDSINFNVFSSDGNSGDSTFIVWDNNIPGALYSVNPGKNQSANFSWTPDTTEWQERPYHIVARVKDNYCDVLGVRDYVYTLILHNDLPVNAFISSSINCGIVEFSPNTDTSRKDLVFEWYGDSGFVSNSRAPVFAYASTGNYRVYLKIYSANNCLLFFDSTMVNYLKTQPVVQLTADTTVCPQSIINLTASASGGTAPYSYLWSTADTTSSILHTAVNEDLISVTITDADNCQRTDSVRISIHSTATINAGNYSGVCLNEDTLLLSGTPAGGKWTGTGLQNETWFNPALADTGQHQLIYKYVDSNGCESSDTAIIMVNPLPQVTTEIDFDICEDAPLKGLSATPVGGTWSGPGVVVDSFSTSASGLGNHLLIYTYTDQKGCTNDDTVIARVRPLPQPDAGNDTALCLYPGSFILQGSPTGGNWSGNGVANNQFSPVTAGSGLHELVYVFSETFGCTANDTLMIMVNPLPEMLASYSVTSNTAQVQFTLTSSNSLENIIWFFGDGDTSSQQSPTHDYGFTDTVFYAYVVAENDQQCRDTVHLNVVLPKPTGIKKSANLNSQLRIYPNPASNTIQIILESANDEITQVRILGMTGAILYWNKETIQDKTSVDISTLSPGIYILEATTRNGSMLRTKFIKN